MPHFESGAIRRVAHRQKASADAEQRWPLGAPCDCRAIHTGFLGNWRARIAVDTVITVNRILIDLSCFE